MPVDDINSALILASLSGRVVDIALPATFGIPDLVEAGALLALDDYRTRHSPSHEERSLFALGDVYDNKLFGYQTDGDVYVTFYNRRVLEHPKLRASVRTALRPTPATGTHLAGTEPAAGGVSQPV